MGDSFIKQNVLFQNRSTFLKKNALNISQNKKSVLRIYIYIS